MKSGFETAPSVATPLADPTLADDHGASPSPTPEPAERQSVAAELDIDGDGRMGALDRCPEQPELYDDVEDDDGCPDRGPAGMGLGWRSPPG